MLVLDNVHTYYGRIHALKGVSLSVERGEIVALIGGNGAGKTTTLLTISGLLRPKQGSITFEAKRSRNTRPTRSCASALCTALKVGRSSVA